MTPGLCLTFLAATATTVPASVARLARSQFERQFRAARPEVRFAFDDPSCPDQGHYEFSSDSLVLSSDRSLWPERREYALSDLIEGRKIEIPSSADPALASIATARAALVEPERDSPMKRWVGGSLLGGAVGAGAGAIASPNAPSRGTNAIVFGLTGALAGAFLSVLWSSL